MPLPPESAARRTADSSAPRLPSLRSALIVWLLALAAVLAASVGTVAVALAVQARSTPGAVVRRPLSSPVATDPHWFIAAAVVTQLTVALVLALAIWIRRYDRLRVLPFQRVLPLGFLGALLVVFGLAPLAQVVGELTSRLLHVDLKASILVTHMAKQSSVFAFTALLACLSVLPGLIEESMFRGYITAAFHARSFWAKLIIPSVSFGIFHLEPTQAAATIFLGIGFALARLYTGSLLPGMLAHALYNGTVLLVARFGDDVEDHEINALPVLFGAALFAFGLAALRHQRRLPVSS